MVLESKIFKSLTPKQRVLKNFIALSVTFLLIFASVDDISSVASNDKKYQIELKFLVN